MKRFEEMGNEMITTLGFENKEVIKYWTAFEKENWQACEKIFENFSKRG